MTALICKRSRALKWRIVLLLKIQKMVIVVLEHIVPSLPHPDPRTHTLMHRPVIQRVTWRVTDVESGSGTREHPGSTDADGTASPIRESERRMGGWEGGDGWERDVKEGRDAIERCERRTATEREKETGESEKGPGESREFHVTADSKARTGSTAEYDPPRPFRLPLCKRRQGGSLPLPQLLPDWWWQP